MDKLPIVEKLRAWMLKEWSPTYCEEAADLIEQLVEALREARPYVPEHHVPIMHKIDSAIAKSES